MANWRTANLPKLQAFGVLVNIVELPHVEHLGKSRFRIGDLLSRSIARSRAMNIDLAMSTNLGIRIPDSKLAREIMELVRDTESPLLFHHSSRVYYWGALAGKRRGLRFDPELLYAGAMFHDMGLTDQYSSAEDRFEVDGEAIEGEEPSGAPLLLDLQSFERGGKRKRVD